jgi:hypothetical protein
MKFDPSAARKRIEKFWSLKAEFGMERSAYRIFLNEIVSDRYVLVNGLQLLRDELQLATERGSDITACGADLSLPTVMTTLAHTNCGDRIHQGEATTTYEHLVAGRFASLSEIGELKLEAFSPTGGGTDDGATLAHVTVAHQLDEPLRKRIYEGNAQSFILVNIDLKTHVGRMDPSAGVVFGRTQESPWREPRAACGAIVGTLKAFNPDNNVHRRIRSDLGEDNYAYLTQTGVRTDDGTDVTAAVASCIVAIQGMLNTLLAFTKESDERGVAHMTASVTVNRVSLDDTIIYLARGTAFHGQISMQGLGTDASKYSAHLVDHQGDRRLLITYAGLDMKEYPVVGTPYAIHHSGAAH